MSETIIVILQSGKRVVKPVLERIKTTGMNDIVTVKYKGRKVKTFPFRGPDGKEYIKI